MFWETKPTVQFLMWQIRQYPKYSQGYSQLSQYVHSTIKYIKWILVDLISIIQGIITTEIASAAKNLLQVKKDQQFKAQLKIKLHNCPLEHS